MYNTSFIRYLSAVLVIPSSVWSSSHCFGTMTSGTTTRKHPFVLGFFVSLFPSPKALKRAKIAPCEALPAPSEGFPAPSEGFPAPLETLSALSKAFPAPSETLPIPSEALPVYLRPSQLCQRPSQVPRKPFQPKGGLS